jgi:hypothetical protein
MWVVVVGNKGDAANAMKHVQPTVEAECGHKLRVLCTNKGGEFTTAKFMLYCVDEGVQRHYSTSYSLQKNNIIELRNQTVVGMARAHLKQRRMPTVFWGEVVLTTIYILNRSPT